MEQVVEQVVEQQVELGVEESNRELRNDLFMLASKLGKLNSETQFVVIVKGTTLST